MPQHTSASPITSPTSVVGHDVGRRTVLGGAAWAGPVIAVSAASPAFASSGDLVLAAASPTAGAFSVSASAPRSLSVLLTRGGAPVRDTVVTFALSGTPWLTLSSPTATTGPDGTATVDLSVPEGATPSRGDEVTVSATVGGLTVAWAVAPRPPLLLAKNSVYGSVMTVVDGRPMSRTRTWVGDLPDDAVITALGPDVMVTDDGSLYVMGQNDGGRLGIGTTSGYLLNPQGPFHLPGDRRAVAAACGNTFSVVADETGDLFTTGTNTLGQLGDGTSTSRATWGPALRGSIPSSARVDSFAAGYSHTVCLTTDGGVHVWGGNTQYELGDATGSSQSSPVPMHRGGIPEGVRIVAVAANPYSSLLLGEDGHLYVCGNSTSGNLSLGATSTARTLTRADRGAIPAHVSITDVAAGYWHTVALGSDGKVYACGANSYGSVGDGTTTVRRTFTEVTGGSVLPLTRFVAVGALAHRSYAVTEDGTVHGWGHQLETVPTVVTMQPFFRA